MQTFSPKFSALIKAACISLPLSMALGAWTLKQLSEVREPLAQVPELSAKSLPLATEIFDRSGLKIGEFSEERRYFVPLSKIPLHVQQAFLSAEDKNFYRHYGVSVSAIMRAFAANLRGVGYRQGASTITQQLARIYFLSQEKSLARKFKEAILALAIERHFSKEQILELYLNSIYLGARSHGVEAAARNYFRKSVAELTVAEAALLAGLPKSPAVYSPQRHPRKARARQAWVLERMEEDRYLKLGAAKRLAALPLRIASQPEDHWSRAPYFVAAVKQDFLRRFEMRGLPRYGLKIYTTLDANLQGLAERNVAMQIHELEKKSRLVDRHHDAIEGAMISVEPRSGAILAMQGGRTFQTSQFNRSADTRRPVGSLINPFLAALALERGYHSLTPVPLESDARSLKRSVFPSSVPLFKILSDEWVEEGKALAGLLGYGSVGDFLTRLQIVSDPVLGRDGPMGIQVAPLKVALAFASLVNGGHEIRPHLVDRIEDREGRVLFDGGSSRVRRPRILDPKVAFVTYELLRAQGLAGKTQKSAVALPHAATAYGSSPDGRDGWVVGLVPDAVTVLWLGSERGKIRLDLGADELRRIAAIFWRHGRSELEALSRAQGSSFTPPAGIAYVRTNAESGESTVVPMIAAAAGWWEKSRL